MVTMICSFFVQLVVIAHEAQLDEIGALLVQRAEMNGVSMHPQVQFCQRLAVHMQQLTEPARQPTLKITNYQIIRIFRFLEEELSI